MFFLLLGIVAAWALRAALDPSPPQVRAERVLDELDREVSRVSSLINRTRPEEAWETLMAIREDYLSSIRARIEHLRAILAELQLSERVVVFLIDGSDVIVSVYGLRAGGLAVGVDGPGLRWDPSTWRIRELSPTQGVTLTCQACGEDGLRFALLSAEGVEGELLRIRGEGKPVLWLPSRQNIQLVDEKNEVVTEFVVVLR